MGFKLFAPPTKHKDPGNYVYPNLTDSTGSLNELPYTFLDERRICDLLDSEEPYWASKRNRKLVTIKGNETIINAMEIMAKNQILSLPVVEPENEKEFMGFIDMVDIIHSILCYYTTNENTKNCENQSKYDNFIPVDFRGTLRQLISEVFQKDIHRVIVFNDDADGIGILSQTDMIKYFLENLDSLGECVHKSVDELKLIDNKVISMHENGISIHAFYLMLFHAVPGIAIVNENNDLVSSISLSDLRGLNADSYPNLLKPTGEFLNNKKTITCTKETSLEVLMLTMFEHKIHRVWVVDSKESKKCIGVITMVDIMKYFATYYGAKLATK
ncbi:hypothetical protein PPL_04625 [Heterostelium album PN500]|uniref:CBS domain-containing protein n=1 Tax=Heterostelium pallidum (strain ATCC 26659 / Pp 5 / PN500) TaxID=670386 RepID=D3B834_HETP5|nr:hypothetical protein PPL_04625 [Heterostelium album PN500]EFA82202.1 hypothetical protein PPL_04625 [Heterostelium album PN500]|eukprot:XP_020434319.1 hypothetical protein PPL_04625 [Heterostelium album PN500]